MSKVNDDDEIHVVINDEDDLFVENPKTLLFNNLGVGTFIVFFLAGVLFFVWFFSFGCSPVNKSLARGIAFLILIFTTVLLIFAPRTSRFVPTALEPEVSTQKLLMRAYALLHRSLILMKWGDGTLFTALR